MSVFLRLTGHSTSEVEAAVVNRTLASMSAVMILIYQIRIEVAGLRRSGPAENGVMNRVISVLMPLVILFVTFYSSLIRSKATKVPAQNYSLGLVTLFMASVVLPIFFILSNDNLKKYVRHKIVQSQTFCWCLTKAQLLWSRLNLWQRMRNGNRHDGQIDCFTTCPKLFSTWQLSRLDWILLGNCFRHGLWTHKVCNGSHSMTIMGLIETLLSFLGS